jgi:Domain of unknown function (DUF4129)
MTTATFDKTSLPWQLQQWGQRTGEWFELKLQELKAPKWVPPDWNLPQFAISPRFWEVLFWLIVFGFVFWAVIKLYPVGQRYWVMWQGASPREQRAKPMPDRPTAEWLQQAQRLKLQGNYPEACRCLYMAMLQRLNDAQVAPHEPSRTDGEYLNLVQRLSRSPAYQILISTHEQLCFGGVSLNADDFSRCQSAYREIEEADRGPGLVGR